MFVCEIFLHSIFFGSRTKYRPGKIIPDPDPLGKKFRIQIPERGKHTTPIRKPLIVERAL
jgi:hypothetical protein